MHSEHIWALSEWRGSKPHFDCAFIKKDTNYESLALPHRLDNLDVACIRLLLSFDYHGVTYQCIIIHGLLLVDDEPDEDTGMWLAHCPDKQISQAIPLNAIYCAAHLIPYYSNNSMPWQITPNNCLDNFYLFYMNKFIDHHTFDLLS